MAVTSGAGDLANELLPSLTTGKDFTFPEVDLDSDDFEIPPLSPDDPLNTGITAVTLEALTEKKIDGNGAFDVLMTAMSNHLQQEYSRSRITGAEYAKTYVELTSVALGNAVQFLLQKDTAFWQGVLARSQAEQARIQLVTAKVQLAATRFQLATAKVEAYTAEANYALTKLKLATEDAQYANVVAQTEATVYQTDNILPVQKELVSEQMETARSQTLDTRSDGVTVVLGSVGKQKDLLNQQITSYQRDSEVKAAKLFTDAWITMKTIDEGLLAPDGFKNASVDVILTKIKTTNGLT